MNDASLEAILTAIQELVDGERRTDIVRDALNYLRRSGTKADQREIASLIKQQTGTLAVPVHARAIAQWLPAFPGTYSRIITLWSSTHPELGLSVEQRLLGRGLHGQASEVPDDLTAGQALAVIHEVADEVMVERPQEDPADVRLMVFRWLYVWDEESVVDGAESEKSSAKANSKPQGKSAAKKGKGRATRPDAPAGTPDSLAESVFHPLLETLHELPAGDPEWALVESFMAEVARLAGVKANEAAAEKARLAEEAATAESTAEALARKANADEALATLLRDHTGDLAAFERDDARSWTLDACLDEQLEAAWHQLGALGELFDSYNELDAERPSQVAERRKHRGALSDLEAQIAECCDDLSRLLCGPSGSGPDETREDDGGSENSPDGVGAGDDASPTTEEDGSPLATAGPGPTEASARQAFGETETGALDPGIGAGSSIGDGVEPDQPEEALRVCVAAETSGDAARLLTEHDGDDYWTQFHWALIAEDDLPGAYWMSASLSAQDRPVSVPAWLLAAAQGGRWVEADSPLVASVRDLAARNSLPEDAQSGMLGLAASLRPALIDPQSGLLGWLQQSGDVASDIGLADLVGAIKQYAEHSFMGLRPEDLDGVAGESERESVIKAAVQDAQAWLEQASGLHTRYMLASAVWRTLIGPGGSLSAVLAPVVKDQRKAAAKVRAGIALWRDDDFVKDQLREVRRGLHNGRRTPEIVAAPAEWLQRRVAETCTYAERWCSLAEREVQVRTHGDWLFEQVRSLRKSVEAALPDAEEALLHLCSDTADPPLAATARTLLRAVVQLRDTFRLAHTDEDVATACCPAAWIPPRQWWLAGADDIQTALSRRLLWVPGVELPDSAVPADVEIPRLATAFRDASAVGLAFENVLSAWVDERKDFRFVSTLLGAGASGEAALDKLADTVAAKEELALTELRKCADRVQREVEQAVVEGVLAEEERAAYSARLEFASSREAASQPGERGVDIGSALVELDGISTELERRNSARISEQTESWDGLLAKLGKRYPAEEIAPIAAFVGRAISARDLVVVGECLADLQEALDSHRELDLGRFTAPSNMDAFDAFRSSVEEIKAVAAARGLRPLCSAVKQGGAIAGFNYGRLNQPRREEVLSAFQAWNALKQDVGSKPQVLKSLPLILRFLGFDLVRTDWQALTAIKTTGDWIHVRAGLSAGDNARPIPQYGSMARGSYDIVCFWGRPGVDKMLSRLAEQGIEKGKAIVLYLGLLNETQRRELVAATRHRKFETVVLDETLLVYLSRASDVRLGDFLRCALPYSTLNPYTPFVAGDVPREMYFGRNDMANDIESIQGSSLVYGGRQLGKSALLRHVQRRFHDPNEGRFAVVEDIKHIGDVETGGPARLIWERVHKAFHEQGLVDGRYRNPDGLSQEITSALSSSGGRRFIMMFDEADNFLDDDSTGDFSEVNALKSLMQQTERRFKMVFAGLHQVQRFQGIPNQPLAHLGKPILVGPLDPISARKLIRSPLEVLGYRLDDASVLRILSYTNYHPGLIQLFCQELLRRLHKPQPRIGPPWDVDQGVIETVYYQDLRESIRERFDWTLALDPRYQVVAWSMIVDQMEDHDGYSQSYAAEESLRLARYWWPARFQGIASDEMRGLLQEMCGLGVLVTSPKGSGHQYRLRSPNLVRLMGTDEDIGVRLVELTDQGTAVREVEPQSLHRWMDSASRFSPLTVGQEQQLNQPRYGACLVFASHALGADALEMAAHSLLPSDLEAGLGVTEQMPEQVQTDDQVTKWLSKFVTAHRRQSRLVVTRVLDDRQPGVVQSVVDACVTFCEDRQDVRGQWLRIILLFPPDAAWAWMSLPEATRRDLELRADTATWAKPLDTTGVRQRLAHGEMMCTPEIVEAVATATGGWPALVQWVMQQASGSDPRTAAARLSEELDDQTSSPRNTLVDALGLTFCPWGRPVLSLLHEWEPLQETELLEVVVNETSLPTQEATATIEFLRRLGCVANDSDGGVRANPVVARVIG
jgi:hypothetical protein